MPYIYSVAKLPERSESSESETKAPPSTPTPPTPTPSTPSLAKGKGIFLSLIYLNRELINEIC